MAAKSVNEKNDSVATMSPFTIQHQNNLVAPKFLNERKKNSMATGSSLVV
jgi:hypothetical protein